MPPDVESRVRAASSDQLDEWIDLILDARELADVFGIDQKHSSEPQEFIRSGRK
ncbi:hypothetical protein WCLP8_5360001 [uncultured Gammaproteobacteria bacterium]